MEIVEIPTLQWSKRSISRSSVLKVCFWEFLGLKIELRVPGLLKIKLGYF